MTFNMAMEILNEWFEHQHGGCDETTCAMSAAKNGGYDHYAIKLLTDAIGFSDDEDDEDDALAYRAYEKIKPMKKWANAVDTEWMRFVKETPHIHCKHCNAVIWHYEDCDKYCSSCGGQS